MSRVLVDTGATYAFVDAGDTHHQDARAYVDASLSRQSVFVLVDLVFAETMTLMKARLGSAIAIRVGRELRENPTYAWHALGADGERETWALFQKYADKGWSFTDCAILGVARRLGVHQVFGFDGHFLQMPGIVRVPSRNERPGVAKARGKPRPSRVR